MKKLNITNYDVDVIDQNGKKKKEPYKLKESFSTILLHPTLNLSGRELLVNFKLANKLEDCQDDFILLEQHEYNTLLHVVETIRGFGKNEVEMVTRIIDCPDVQVEEKKDVS